MRPAQKYTGVLLAILLGIYPTTSEPQELSPAALTTAHELEKRLMAPCCWRETLDIHESPTASGLRHEIRTRIANGESTSAIEAELVRRHGPRLRATLPDSLGYILFGFASLFGIVVLGFMIKKTGSPRSPVSARRPEPVDTGIPPAERRRLENLLDDDLEKEPS